MRLTRPVPLAMLCAALAVPLAGCGQSEEREQVREVASAFNAALEQQDGTAACTLLSSFLAEEVASQGRAPCQQAILDLDLTTDRVDGVSVYVTTAQDDFNGGEHAYLDRASEGWRLTAVGCRFEDGKPRDRPASCEAES